MLLSARDAKAAAVESAIETTPEQNQPFVAVPVAEYSELALLGQAQSSPMLSSAATGSGRDLAHPPGVGSLGVAGQSHAAVVIQAAFRGHNTRTKLQITGKFKNMHSGPPTKCASTKSSGGVGSHYTCLVMVRRPSLHHFAKTSKMQNIIMLT